MDFYKLSSGLFKRLRQYSIYQKNRRHYISVANKKVNELNCKPLSTSQKKEIREYYAHFGFKNINTKWHQYYSHISGKFYKEYIPVELYVNVIEPQLNMITEPEILIDKNLINRIFNTVEQPKTVVKNINGFFLDQNNNIIDINEVIEICLKYAKIIIKPSLDSGAGKNITVFEQDSNTANDQNKIIRELINLYNKNFIIQKYFIQHSKMSDLNESSVNTLRIQTLLIGREVEILASFVRIGSKGSVVDNLGHPNSGKDGIMCNVGKDGLLNSGFNSVGNSVLKTNTNIKLKGYEIPNYSNIINVVKNLHKQILYFRIVSWDIAINEIGNPVLIEYNVSGQHTPHQFATGPLFGKFSDEILTQCKVSMFSKVNMF